MTVPDFQNPSMTLMLVDDFTGTGGADLDADDDGVVDDWSFFTTVRDAICIPDSSADQACCYGAQLGGVDTVALHHDPWLAFRGGSAGSWHLIDTWLFLRNILHFCLLWFSG